MSGFTSLGKKSLGGVSSFNVNSAGPFGTTLTSNMAPTGQSTFTYGINSTMWLTGSTGAGASVTASEAVVTCSSGTSLSGSASVTLLRGNKYRAGQGGMARFTAIFGPGAPDTLQLAGIFNIESGYHFAVSGSNSFGILHRETSKREVRSFTITSPPAGAATLVVTLNGSPITVSINGGGSNNQTSHQISQGDYSQVGSGWTSESIDGIVYFLAKNPGPQTGTFSITNGGVSIATTSTVQSGVLPVDTFISQSSWNIDRMDGSGASRFTLDRTKGNVYGIGYQYLGFGNSMFSVEDPETGLLTACHMIQRSGTSTSVNIRNPLMTVGWITINSGSQASSVSVKGASAAAFNEGNIVRNIGTSFSAVGIKNNISSTEVPVLTIRANTLFNNQCCYGEVVPFNLSAANDSGASASGKILKVFVYKNIGLGGPVNFTHVDSTKSMVAYDTSATSIITGGRTQLLKSIIISANGSQTLKLEDENMFLTAGETLTITAQRVTSDLDAAAVSISWFEDQ